MKTARAMSFLFAFASLGASDPQRRKDETDSTLSLEWLVPDFAKIQTGSYAGLFTSGAGYTFLKRRLDVSLLFGVAPNFHSGNTVYLFEFAADVRPFDLPAGPLRVVPVFIGPGVIYSPNAELFVSVPDRYPTKAYYPPTALMWMMRLGTEFDLVPASASWVKRHGLYAQATVLFRYAELFFNNPGSVSLTDVIGGGIGYRIEF